MVRPVEKLNVSLRAVVYREADVWIAHCLELDIAAEGDSPRDAVVPLQDLGSLQVRVAMEDGDLDSIFRFAPPKVWRMYWMGQQKRPSRRAPAPIDWFDARQLALF